ncbi:MAG: hypothetical protein JNL70_15680 [Saprospiraceae bacterium]|nr:hypothetical protein [Saprospiraceae bacterium]
MFKIGDFVKIKDGIMDADENKYHIGGWQGHIIGVQDKDNDDDENIYEIHWDSQTMRIMPTEYIETALEEGLSWSTYYAGESEVETTFATEELIISQEFADKLEDTFFEDED